MRDPSIGLESSSVSVPPAIPSLDGRRARDAEPDDVQLVPTGPKKSDFHPELACLTLDAVHDD
jgi:hypothetical protein